MANILESNTVSYVCACGHLNPITKLFFCRHCLKPRCGFCVCHEVSLKLFFLLFPNFFFLKKFFNFVRRSILIFVTIVWRIFHPERQNWKSIDVINASNAPAANIHFRLVRQLYTFHAKVMQKLNQHRPARRPPVQMLRKVQRRPLAKCTIYHVWLVVGRLVMLVFLIKQTVWTILDWTTKKIGF